MKRLYTLLLGGFVAMSVSAQNISIVNAADGSTVTNGTMTVMGGMSESDVHEDLTITNTTGASMNVMVQRREMSYPGASTGMTYFCWQLCYAPKALGTHALWPTQANAANEYDDVVPVGSQASWTCNMHLKPNGTAGDYVIRYIAYDFDNPSDSSFVDVTFSILDDTGIEDYFASENVSIYPVPANEELNVAFNSSTNIDAEIEVVVSNMLGQQVESMNVLGNAPRVTFNTSDYTDGVYFVSFKAAGKVIKTQKIVVRH